MHYIFWASLSNYACIVYSLHFLFANKINNIKVCVSILYMSFFGFSVLAFYKPLFDYKLHSYG